MRYKIKYYFYNFEKKKTCAYPGRPTSEEYPNVSQLLRMQFEDLSKDHPKKKSHLLKWNPVFSTIFS